MLLERFFYLFPMHTIQYFYINFYINSFSIVGTLKSTKLRKVTLLNCYTPIIILLNILKFVFEFFRDAKKKKKKGIF